MILLSKLFTVEYMDAGKCRPFAWFVIAGIKGMLRPCSDFRRVAPPTADRSFLGSACRWRYELRRSQTGHSHAIHPDANCTTQNAD